MQPSTGAVLFCGGLEMTATVNGRVPARSAQRAIEGLEAQGAAALVLADDVMAAPTTATITEAFVSTLKKALAGDGISILDVPVDYSHNVEIGAELHDDVFE